MFVEQPVWLAAHEDWPEPEPRKLSEAPPEPLPPSVAEQPVAADSQNLSTKTPPAHVPRPHSMAGKEEIHALYEAPPVPRLATIGGRTAKQKSPQEAPPVPLPQPVAERMQPDTPVYPSMAKTPSGQWERALTLLQRWWSGVMEPASPTILGLMTTVLQQTNRRE